MSSKLKRKRKGEHLVRLVLKDKVYEMSPRMAQATIEVAREKYMKENANAIVGVQKDDIISMMRDVFDTTAALEEAVTNWEHGGYTCYYVKAKGGQ